MSTHYLPYIGKQHYAGKAVGIDIPFPNDDKALKVAKTGVKIATIGSLRYRDDNPFDKYDVSLMALAKAKIDPIVILHGAPIYMRTDQGFGSIRAEYFQQYADFCATAVARYPGVRYWQIWNEPDVLPAYAVPDYYGGWGGVPEAYANFVSVCAQAMRAVRKDIKLSISLAGDFLWMDAFHVTHGTRSIDQIHLHHYAWWGDDLGDSLDKLVGKTRKMREYGKAAWVTETNLLSNDSMPAYENDKRVWVKMTEKVLEEPNVPVLMFYSWRSGWKNADIEGLPAEKALVELCKKYN